MGRKYKIKEIRQCLQCGKDTTNKKFCSLSCGAIYQHEHEEKRKLICKNCGNTFEPEHGIFRNFCNHSCSAIFNNKKRGKKVFNCLNCGKILLTQKKYCNGKCQHEYQYNEYIKKWKNGEVSGLIAKYYMSGYIIRYLRIKYNNSCSECGWNKINPSTNKVPLDAHHTDGNFKNNKEENLELLCGCCHSLTPTYGGLNRGNGRTERYRPLNSVG